MKRREYLTGVAGVGALTAVGATAGVAAASNHTIGTITDPSGDDYGPGTYTYPGSSEFKDGVYDMESVTITDEGDAWGFTVSIAGPVENPYSYDAGFSVQAFQLYIRDPDAPSDAPTSTDGRAGTISNFAQPYHYRVHVQGNGTTVVEDASATDPAEATVISENVSATANPDDGSITFTVPKSAIGGGSIEDKHAALLLFSHDGFGTAGIRTNFAPEADTYTFGGVEGEILNAPRVIDLLDPEGVINQQDALSYSDSAKPEIPLFRLGDAIESGGGGSGGGSQDSGSDGGFAYPATATDPVGDDYGPGTYTYPGSSEFKDGVYDMSEVTVADGDDTWDFTVAMDGPVENPYSYDAGFSVQAFQLYVHDPEAGSDAPMSTDGRAGTISNFAQPYHYRVHVQGNSQVVEDASATDPSEANVLSEDVTASGNPSEGTITFSVPKDAIGGDLSNKRAALLLFSHDGFGTAGIRTNFAPEADTYTFGGVEGEILNAPRVIDLLDPSGVLDQQQALSYSDSAKPEIPLMPVTDLFQPAQTGGGGEEQEEPEGPPDADNDGTPDGEDFATQNPDIQDPPSETVPGGQGPPQNTDGDGQGYAEDIDGDGDADADDVRSLLNNRRSDAVQNNAGYFDYDNDGSITISDVAELYKRIFR